MLSIRHMTAGKENYYLQLAREDYYLEGGEPPGRWFGRAAESLGLDGTTVEKATLRSLIEGFAPDRTALVQNAGKPNRQPGWDLTFSAPKSVSTLWSQLDSDGRQMIQAAHDAAVRRALAYLQQHAAWTRRGPGGVELEPVGLAVAIFEHGTSRAQDPQLHDHCLVLNLGLRADGSWGAIRSEDFYHHKMVAGALYRAGLAHELRGPPGLDPVPKDEWFELRSVSEKLIAEFSTRREQIEQAIAEGSLRTAEAFANAALATRSHKEHAARSELFAAWQDVGRSLGFGPAEASRLIGRGDRARSRPNELELSQAVTDAIAELERDGSFFRARDVVRGVARRVQHGRFSVDALLDAAGASLQQQVFLAVENGYALFATPATLDAERRIFELVAQSQHHNHHSLPVAEPVGSGGERASDRLVTISKEQADAIRHVTEEAGGVKLVSGVAGSGKSRLLHAAREEWERAGFRVLGAAVAGKATRELESASGIRSDTLARTLLRLGSDVPGLEPARSGPARSAAEHDRLTLDEKTVLVIDEAAMVGTMQLLRVLTLAAAASAKVVLVGDERQLPAIDAGSPFGGLVRRFGAARLNEVHRQQDAEHRLATASLADGDVQTALGIYASRGRVRTYANEAEALGHLVGTWQEHRTANLAQSLILAGTNAQVDRLNELAQRVRRSRGELSGAAARLDGVDYFVGDRVRFTRNNRGLGVWNGDGGTVTKIDRRTLRGYEISVRLDATERRGFFGPRRHREVTFRTTGSSAALRLGYAATVHAAQGSSVDRTFVLAGDWMAGRELSYVQMTRHREDMFIAASAGVLGEDLEQLADAMSMSQDRRLAVEVQARAFGLDQEQELTR